MSTKGYNLNHLAVPDATYQGSRPIAQLVLEKFLKVFTTYGCDRHFGPVTKPSCIFFFFHYSQKLSHHIWFQIGQQFLRKTKFKFENGVTFVDGQIMIVIFM